jgi:hypothetical protein
MSMLTTATAEQPQAMASRTGSAAPAHVLDIAPLLMLRIAALSYGRLQAAGPEESWRQLDLALLCEEAIAALDASVAKLLHDRIPHVQDDALRHCLLHYKRSAAAGKPLRMDDQQESLAGMPQLLIDLPTLSVWLAYHRQRNAALSGLRHCLATEMDTRTRPALRASLADACFAHALALNAPRLQEKLQDPREWNHGSAASSKSERTLMNFMARAAAKTSPLHTFMLNAWASLDAGAARSHLKLDAVLQPRTLTVMNRGIVARLARAVDRQPWAPQRERLNPNASLRIEAPGSVRALVYQSIELLGRPWRQDRLTRFQMPAPLRVTRCCARWPGPACRSKTPSPACASGCNAACWMTVRGPGQQATPIRWPPASVGCAACPPSRPAA